MRAELKKDVIGMQQRSFGSHRIKIVDFAVQSDLRSALSPFFLELVRLYHNPFSWTTEPNTNHLPTWVGVRSNQFCFP